MPLPKPKKGESRNEFFARCMADETMKREFPDRQQRYAVCQRQWNERNEKQSAARDVICLRQPTAFSAAGLEVDADAGVLRNVSVITRGLAFGHDFVIDDVMLRQVCDGINDAPDGLKCRLTHPELAGGWFGPEIDPIEVLVGRVRNARVDGDRVRADVHLGAYADLAPRGRLRSYLLAVAEEDPAAIGLSIVFEPDEFEPRENGPPAGRVRRMVAVDFVGDPAANPGGLLSRGPLGKEEGEMEDLKPMEGETRDAFIERFVNDPDMQAKYPDEEERRRAAEAAWDAAQSDADGADASDSDSSADEPDAGTDAAPNLSAGNVDVQTVVRKAVQQALQAEQRRRDSILALARENGLSLDWARGLADRGVSVEQARELVRLAKEMQPVRVTVGDDLNRTSLGPAICDAIRLRAGATIEKPHERAREFRGLTLVDMYRHWLHVHGVPDAFTLSRVRVVELMSRRELLRAYPTIALSLGTDDFDSILADAARKTLLQAYKDGEPTWKIWARRATAPDFKTINRTALSEVPDLAERKEGGEVQYVSLSDRKESYALVEYTNGIRLTRQAIINDDLDAFGRIPELQGYAAARKEDDVAYTVITANAAMSDGVALFHSSHGNLVSGGGAPSVEQLAKTEKLLMKQKGPKGAARLELRGRYVLVPSSIYRQTQQLISSPVDPAKSNDAPNPFYNEGLVVVPSGRLDDDSATAWYLLADWKQIDTVEVCFLEDEPEPVLKQETDFDTDDVKFVVRHTVAAKAVDWRGMVKNPGA